MTSLKKVFKDALDPSSAEYEARLAPYAPKTYKVTHSVSNTAFSMRLHAGGVTLTNLDKKGVAPITFEWKNIKYIKGDQVSCTVKCSWREKYEDPMEEEKFSTSESKDIQTKSTAIIKKKVEDMQATKRKEKDEHHQPQQQQKEQAKGPPERRRRKSLGSSYDKVALSSSSGASSGASSSSSNRPTHVPKLTTTLPLPEDSKKKGKDSKKSGGDSNEEKVVPTASGPTPVTLASGFTQRGHIGIHGSMYGLPPEMAEALNLVKAKQLEAHVCFGGGTQNTTLQPPTNSKTIAPLALSPRFKRVEPEKFPKSLASPRKTSFTKKLLG